MMPTDRREARAFGMERTSSSSSSRTRWDSCVSSDALASSSLEICFKLRCPCLRFSRGHSTLLVPPCQVRCTPTRDLQCFLNPRPLFPRATIQTIHSARCLSSSEPEQPEEPLDMEIFDEQTSRDFKEQHMKDMDEAARTIREY